MEWLEEQHETLKKDHKLLTTQDQIAQGDNTMLKRSNENYRNVVVKNEAVLAQQSGELKDLKKRTETTKKEADRLKEENEILIK